MEIVQMELYANIIVQFTWSHYYFEAGAEAVAQYQRITAG